MTETQKRIEAYQKALPGIREKVVAVAMLLALSVIMLTSASFAWLTISRAPEVTQVATNVTANGNLEIALADRDGEEPEESGINDSFSAEGGSIVASNITWGNLINLNDPSYGIDKIVLRPALIGGSTNLIEKPLEGANYGNDGRLEKYYNEDFKFTSWNPAASGGLGRFDFYKTPQYGVRAISTVKYEYTQDDLPLFLELLDAAKQARDDTNNQKYQTVIGNKTYIDALAGLMGDYLQDNVLGDGSGNVDITKYMPDLFAMFEGFYGAILDFENALVALANAQIYDAKGPDEYLKYTYKPSDEMTAAEDLLDDTDAELASKGVQFTASLKEYKRIREAVKKLLYGDEIDYGSKEYKDLNSDDDTANDVTLDCFRDYYLLAVGPDGKTGTGDEGTVTYVDVEDKYINSLIKISSCKIISNKGGVNATVGEAGGSIATKLLGKDDIQAIIQDGLIKDFETLSGCKMNATKVTIKVMGVGVTAQSITTSAPTSGGIFDTDCGSIEQIAREGTDYTATSMETYGMAIDYWVRTNAEDSYLVLEGAPEIETEQVRETSHDSEGNVVELWTVTVTRPGAEGSENITQEVPIYIVDGEYYRANNNLPLVLNEGETMTEPVERYKQIINVIGYEGENRVWGEDPLIAVNSTTQGGGSCYIFYAEDPAQQDYCIRLLKNLRIAFLDANVNSSTYGKKVAVAKLDTDMRYESGGKVTIPIVLIDDTTDSLTKAPGIGDGLAICKLEQNVPTLLTTVVYLDGKEMSNAEVLATEDIQGQLNIQFKTTEELTPVEDEKLQLETRDVSVIAKKSGDASYPSSNSSPIEFNFEEDEGKMSIDLKLKVDGSAPRKVSAFFMREVNQWQGSKEETFDFVKSTEEDGYWYCTYTFKNPGKYTLKTVQLDGIDYDLSRSPAMETLKYPTVNISGFNISQFGLYHDGNMIIDKELIVMSDRNNAKMDVNLKFGTTKQPESVRVQFVEESGRNVFAVLSSNPDGTWTGSANFTLSGTYTMEKIMVDGEYFQLNPQDCRKLMLYLGMKAEVKRLSGAIDGALPFTGPEEVKFGVRIFDNSNTEVKYLTDMGLIYGRSAADTFKTSLVWNGNTEQYEGIFPIQKPGVWSFIGVSVGQTSTIGYTTNTPPEFTRISLDPVSYEGNETPENAYYIDYDATKTDELIGIRLKNAESATVTLELINKHENDKVYTITKSGVAPPNGSNISTYWFDLREARPADGSDAAAVVKEKGLGGWEVQKVSLHNVSSGTGDNINFHDENNPFVIENEVKELKVELVSVDVKVTNNAAGTTVENVNLDKNKVFMSEESAERPITVKVTDHRGQPLKAEIGNPSLNLKYAPGSSERYGGYKFTNSEQEPGDIALVVAKGADPNTFEAAVTNITTAGIYDADILSFELTLNGETRTISYTSEARKQANSSLNLPSIAMPTYTRKTDAPTVVVADISPKGAHTTVNKNKSQINVTSTMSDYSVKIYAEATASTDGCGNTTGDIKTEPTVTLRIIGMGNADTAVLTFTSDQGDVLLYQNSGRNQTDSYTWDNTSETVLRYIGNYANGCGDADDAGKLTSANVLILRIGDCEFTVTITQIVIDNTMP